MNLDKNKYRSGYMKLIASLDSCESWEQFESWDRMAQNFFNMVDFDMTEMDKYSFWHFWHRRSFNIWLEEIDFMFNDIKQRRQEFYDYNKKREEESDKPKQPIVVTGFKLDD